MAGRGDDRDIDAMLGGFRTVSEVDLDPLGHGDAVEADLQLLGDRSFPGGVAPVIAAAGTNDLGHLLILLATFVEWGRWRRRYDHLDD